MWHQLWTMISFDLRQGLRDKSVIIFSLIVPLALMGVLHLVISPSIQTDLRPITVAAAGVNDARSEVLTTVLTEGSGLEVTVDTYPAEEVRAAINDGQAHLGIIVPPEFSAELDAGRGPEITVITGDGRGLESVIAVAVLRTAVDQLNAGVVTAHAAAGLGVPGPEIDGVVGDMLAASAQAGVERGQTPREQLTPGGSIVAGQAGMFLIFTVSFGVIGLITEREQGTMTRLRSMPMPHGLIVTAKAGGGFILGLVATTVLLTIGGLLFDVSFGSLPLVAIVVVAGVLAATSLVFLIARVARTAEQAGVAQAITAIVLGIAGGAFFPLTASGWVATVLDLNPIAAFIRGLGITSGGGELAQLGGPLLIMLAFAAVMLLIARVVPQREGI